MKFNKLQLKVESAIMFEWLLKVFHYSKIFTGYMDKWHEC